MAYRLLIVVATLLVAHFASAQVSFDQAMARLREKQAKRQATSQPNTRAAENESQSSQKSQQEMRDASIAMGEFVKKADEALNSGDERSAKLDACFASILDHSFRLTAKAKEITRKVPIGDPGLFGDRPDQALLVSFPALRNTATSKPQAAPAQVTIADLYLAAPDDYLKAVEKEANVRGRVVFTRVEIDPAESTSGGHTSFFVGKLKILGRFEPDIPWRPVSPAAPLPAPASPRVDPLAPIVGSIPSSQAGGLINEKKIVFVCDASGSMLQKFGALKVQLSRTVRQLNHGQSFNIIFFQEQRCNSLSEKLLLATPETKREADIFLDTIVPRAETNPLPALDLAFKQQPDLVFLLTDGDFPDNKAVLKHIRELERARKVKINTVAFVSAHDVDTDFVALLKVIARETGGTYRYVRESDL